MNIDLREELRKRDELLDGYLKQIEIFNNPYHMHMPFQSAHGH